MVPAELLGIDTGDHNDERASISWSAPNVLPVSVLHFTFLEVLTLHADGVDVDLQIDPHDGADRAAYPKQFAQRPP